MTQSPSFELQKSITTALSNNADVKSACGKPTVPVYDDVTQGTQQPYIVIGDGYERDAGGEGDPATLNGIVVGVYDSSVAGFEKVKKICAAVRVALYGLTVTPSGFKQTQLWFKEVQYRRDPDMGALRMGHMLFEAELRPDPPQGDYT